MEKRIPHNKLTWEQVKQSFIEVHGEDTYGYDDVVYIDTHSKVDIYCKKHNHIFNQLVKDHKRGMGCPICGRERQIESAKKDQTKFIDELKEVHGDVFDLSRLNYINTKTDVELGCSKHSFFKRKPADLVLGLGCKKCKLEKSKYNNRSLFIEESIKLFGDITDHSKVEEISATTKVELRCTIHNHKFIIDIGNRLGGQKCPKCAEENYNQIRTLPLEEYYSRCNKKHNNKYAYIGDYKGAKEDVTFYCAMHGENKRNAGSHMHGAGCIQCPSEDSKTDRLGKDGYIKLSKGRQTSLYLIKCSSEQEVFYKIGKTFRGVDKRFTKRNMPYAYEILFELTALAGDIWELERGLHKKYKSYKYKTDIVFEGHTETYNLNLPIDEIVKL